MKRECLKKVGALVIACAVLMTTLLTHTGEASAAAQEKFTKRFGEMMYHQKYYSTFTLAANTDHVFVTTSCQEPSCTVKANATLALGTLTGYVYRSYPITNSGTRSTTREWRLGEKGYWGGAIVIDTSHYINGGNQKQFHASYANPTSPTDGIPSPY